MRMLDRGTTWNASGYVQETKKQHARSQRMQAAMFKKSKDGREGAMGNRKPCSMSQCMTMDGHVARARQLSIHEMRGWDHENILR